MIVVTLQPGLPGAWKPTMGLASDQLRRAVGASGEAAKSENPIGYFPSGNGVRSIVVLHSDTVPSAMSYVQPSSRWTHLAGIGALTIPLSAVPVRASLLLPSKGSAPTWPPRSVVEEMPPTGAHIPPANEPVMLVEKPALIVR